VVFSTAQDVQNRELGSMIIPQNQNCSSGFVSVQFGTVPVFFQFCVLNFQTLIQNDAVAHGKWHGGAIRAREEVQWQVRANSTKKEKVYTRKSLQ
jgi:hypothetical protein